MIAWFPGDKLSGGAPRPPGATTGRQVDDLPDCHLPSKFVLPDRAVASQNATEMFRRDLSRVDNEGSSDLALGRRFSGGVRDVDQQPKSIMDGDRPRERKPLARGLGDPADRNRALGPCIRLTRHVVMII